MRIAFLSYEYPPDSSFGGIATYVEQAAKMMVNRGHEVEVFASSGLRDEVVETNGVLVHWIREVDRRDFGLVAGYRFALRHTLLPFDIIEGPDFQADARKAVTLAPSVAFVLRMHTPSKLVHQLNAQRIWRQEARYSCGRARQFAATIFNTGEVPPLVLSMGQSRQVQHELEMYHAKSADVIAPPCLDLCEYARNVWRIAHEKIRLVPYPYRPRPELLNIEPRETGQTVGFVGRLERRKGIETLVRAIPLILKVIPEAKFRLVGSALVRPGTAQFYDNWIRESLGSMMDAVQLVGKVELSEMSEIYRGMDICVFPSLWENFPNVCLEAMAAGRAVVGSEAGGMSEMLDKGVVGRLIRPDDARQLADVVIRLLKAPQERVRLGIDARARVIRVYNQDVIGELTEGLYLKAMEARTKMTRDVN